MKRVLVVIVVIATAGAIGRTAPAETSAASLAELFKPGVMLQDRNGDGAIDFVDARIVLAGRPEAAEIAAATNIAARLGFETSAMDIPVATVRLPARRSSADDDRSGGGKPDTTYEGVTTFVGAKSLAAANVTAESIGAAGLKPGDGVVTAFTLSGKPAVAVLGGDETGLNAASVMLAGHLPYVWDQKGPTTDKIADDVKLFLAGKGLTPASAVANAVFVRA